MTQAGRPETGGKTHLDLLFGKIMQKLSARGGFASLTITERKFLFALCVASVVPADSKILPVEIGTLKDVLRSRYGLHGEDLSKAMIFARGRFATRGEFRKLAAALQELLSIEDRCTLIGEMWHVALADKELHDLERQLIFELADLADVPRKRTLEQQGRGATRG